MDINELRDKWQDFLAATLSAKYWKSDSTQKDMMEKLKQFDEFWEKYKDEQQSRNREGNPGKTENNGI